MARLPDLTAREMGATTGVHGYDAGRKSAEERQHLVPPVLPAQDRSPRGVGPVKRKHLLRQIEPDRGNLRRDRSPPVWIVPDPLWHRDAFRGAVTSSEPCRGRDNRPNHVNPRSWGLDHCSAIRRKWSMLARLTGRAIRLRRPCPPTGGRSCPQAPSSKLRSRGLHRRAPRAGSGSAPRNPRAFPSRSRRDDPRRP